MRGVLVVTDKASGKSRGFGCVDMEKLDDALHAIKWLNHADLKGKRIRIHPGPLREQNELIMLAASRPGRIDLAALENDADTKR